MRICENEKCFWFCRRSFGFCFNFNDMESRSVHSNNIIYVPESGPGLIIMVTHIFNK